MGVLFKLCKNINKIVLSPPVSEKYPVRDFSKKTLKIFLESFFVAIPFLVSL